MHGHWMADTIARAMVYGVVGQVFRRLGLVGSIAVAAVVLLVLRSSQRRGRW